MQIPGRIFECQLYVGKSCQFLALRDFVRRTGKWDLHVVWVVRRTSRSFESNCDNICHGNSDSDAGCTQIIAPGKPPVAGGGTRCVKLPNPEAYQGYNDKYDGWCNESISQLVRRIPPAECRDPVPSSTTSTTTIGRRPQMTCPTPSVFPECTLPAPPIPPIPLRYGNWVCEPTCSYKWQPWLLIRTVVTDGYKHSLQCQGPNESSCTFYNDSQCSIPVPGQPPQLPGNNNTGLVCNDTSRPWWCGAITNYHYPYSNTSPYTWHCNYTRYMCIESCSDGRKKNIGVWLDPEDRISCVWNKTAGSCVEFPDIRCYNDSRESYEDPLGPGCNDEGGGWCKDASDVLRRNGSPTCVLATSTASSQSTPTGSAVPNGAGRTWRSYGGLAFLVPAMLSLFHSF